MSDEQDRPKPAAWRCRHGPDNRWFFIPHRPIIMERPERWQEEPLYPASAIKWWLERAARECESRIGAYLEPYERNAGANIGCSECAAAIRNLIEEVEL